MNFFVSYTTIDVEVTKELLTLFSTKLNSIGKVFVDILDNDSMDKQKRVFAELDKSDILILVESKSIYKSKWVLLELEIAKKRAMPIIKIKLDKVDEFIYNSSNL